MTSSPEQVETSYSCNPKWHGGQKAQANFFIQAPEDTPLTAESPAAYAVCEAHAGNALRVMLFYYKTVRVREVNK